MKLKFLKALLIQVPSVPEQWERDRQHKNEKTDINARTDCAREGIRWKLDYDDQGNYYYGRKRVTALI
jgi:hypothetical protein